MRIVAVFVLVFALLKVAFAFDTAPAFSDPAMQERYMRLTQELRCLKCQNETIADSHIPVAADLRRQVRDMMAAGKSDAEIRQFMIDRYGDFVSFRPPVAPRTWLLWGAPVLLLAIGVATAFVIIQRRARLPQDAPDSDVGVS